MTNQNKSTIERSWKTTINYVIAAVISAAVSALLFMYIASGPVTIGIALIPAVLAIVFVFMAMSGAGVCQCPSCGKPMGGLSTRNNDGVLCQECKHYFEGNDGQLWATDESRIADSPTFTSPLPEQFVFPDACCVCGKPPTQRLRISLTTTNASSALTESTIGLKTTSRTSVEVPHCAEHKDDASLTGTQQNVHVKFRSYPYLRAFCEANKTAPG